MEILCLHLNQVGDLAFSLPALRCIRNSFPGARITSVIRPGLVELLQATDLVDEVLSRKSGINLHKLQLMRSLRARHFDTAVSFSQSATCAILARCSGAPKRIGFADTSLGFLLTSRVEFHHPPSTENNLRLVEAVGCSITCRSYSGMLRPTSVQTETADAILAEHGVTPGHPIAALAPGTSGRRSVKEWTDEGFAAVGCHLAGRSIRPVILGTQPVDNVVEKCPEILDLSGKTNLGEALAVLARSRLVVAVDSGMLHLAAAAQTPVIGLYGSSNPAVTGPQGDGHVVITSGADCSPCVRTECSLGRKCMLEITAGQVIAAVDAALDVQGADS